MTESVRPSVPRPRTSVAPTSSAPPPAPTSDVRMVRERIATLDLDEGDIVGVAPVTKSSAPPPPPPSKRSAPPVPPPSSNSNAPPPPVAPAPAPVRATMSDPMDVIFERLYSLAFARSTNEAGAMCAETLAKALGARAVVVHVHDLRSHELRAIAAHGDGDFDVLGSAEASDDDLVASAVICNQASVTMRFDGELPRVAPRRLHAVGAPRTLVAAPALSWGRCLAIIEVIDADERHAARVSDSLAYVAEQFARFLLDQAA